MGQIKPQGYDQKRKVFRTNSFDLRTHQRKKFTINN